VPQRLRSGRRPQARPGPAQTLPSRPLRHSGDGPRLAAGDRLSQAWPIGHAGQV